MIYFGTAYGWLWAYDTSLDRFRSIELDGCPIVSSPLVIRKDGRDLVVVGDKDTSSQNCFPGPGGKAWLVWGFDTDNEPQKESFALGGWVTPSAVPGASPDTFVVGADGVACREGGASGNGKVLQLEVHETGQGYSLRRTPWRSTPCTASGQAGSFASDGETVYWTDVDGHLYARRLTDGAKPANWPDRLNLPALIGGSGSRAFTNTEPAIDKAGAALFVTLRNFVAPGDTTADGQPLQLRGCSGGNCQATGAPGAVIALDLTTATKKWAARLPATASNQSQPSINTSPLVLRTRGALSLRRRERHRSRFAPRHRRAPRLRRRPAVHPQNAGPPPSLGRGAHARRVHLVPGLRLAPQP